MIEIPEIAGKCSRCSADVQFLVDGLCVGCNWLLRGRQFCKACKLEVRGLVDGYCDPCFQRKHAIVNMWSVIGFAISNDYAARARWLDGQIVWGHIGRAAAIDLLYALWREGFVGRALPPLPC